MGILDRLWRPRRVLQDPTFGELVFSNGEWTGEVAFPPCGLEVMVKIELPSEEPGQEHRAAFASLSERYSALEPAIAAALFSLWEPHLKPWRGDRPPVVTSPEEMLSHTSLDWIEIQSATRFRLGYGFTEDVGWDDAMFSLRVVDGVVSPEGLAD